MKKILIMLLLAFSLGVMNTVFAGAPKPSHPCYDVADCKTQTSKKDFSQCIKANKEEADKNTTCAAFRSNKKAYMNKMGMSGPDELFN